MSHEVPVREPDDSRAAGRAAPRRESLGDATRRRLNTSPWNWLLLLPLVLVLLPWFYNRRSPELFDIPFFYWYQLLAIPISMVATVLVYVRTRGER